MPLIAKNMDLAYLHKLLRLDPETGKLYWRENDVKDRQWHGRCAGKEAFTAVNKGYRVTKLDGQNLQAHRVIFALANGWWPDEVDHRDGDTLNNRPGNLRPADRAQQLANSRPRARKFKGAYPTKAGRWMALTKIAGKQKYHGSFGCETAAAIAAAKVMRQHFGAYSHTGMEARN